MCLVLGAAFHYIVLNATLWWFFHVCSIFFKMAFPLTAQRNKPRQLIVHLALTVLGKKFFNHTTPSVYMLAHKVLVSGSYSLSTVDYYAW